MYLSFDVGTTSVKTALFDRQGRLRAKAIKDYVLATPQVDWYEVDPRVYWDAVLSGFRETLAGSGIDPKQVKAVGGCSQGETIVFLDEHDDPVRPAIVWIDNRAKAETAELKTRVDREEFYQKTGCTEIETTWSLLKVHWLQNHEPETLGRTRKLLLVADYIDYLLTGVASTTPTLSQSTGFIDIHARSYWSELVEPLGIRDSLPDIVEVGSVVGRLKASVADGLGLSREVVVVKGAMDQSMSAIGAGNVAPGVVTETTGTALAIGVTSGEVEPIHHNRLAYQPHAIPGSYLILPYAQTSGIIYKWFRNTFGAEEVRKAGGLEGAYEELNRLAADAPAGSNGLVLLPFFAGAYIPENDMNAKGVWYGLTLGHDKRHFSRSILESVGYMLRRILELIQAAGIEIDEVRCMGGAARSDLWLQIKADICGLPMVRMKEEETSTLGCALVAAVAVGDYGSVGEAASAMVSLGRGFEPEAGSRATYDRLYELYAELYGSLKPVFRKYADFQNFST
jgi:xylulokinase